MLKQRALRLILEIYLTEPGLSGTWGGCVRQGRGWLTVYAENFKERIIQIRPIKGGGWGMGCIDFSDDDAKEIIHMAELHIEMESGGWSYDRAASECAKKESSEVFGLHAREFNGVVH